MLTLILPYSTSIHCYEALLSSLTIIFIQLRDDLNSCSLNIISGSSTNKCCHLPLYRYLFSWFTQLSLSSYHLLCLHLAISKTSFSSIFHIYLHSWKLPLDSIHHHCILLDVCSTPFKLDQLCCHNFQCLLSSWHDTQPTHKCFNSVTQL